MNLKLDGHIRANEVNQKTILDGQNALADKMTNQMAQLFTMFQPCY